MKTWISGNISLYLVANVDFQNAAPYKKKCQNISQVLLHRLISKLFEQFQQHLIRSELDFFRSRLWNPRLPPAKCVISRAFPHFDTKILADDVRAFGLEHGVAFLAGLERTIRRRATARTALHFKIEKHWRWR